MGYGMGMGHMFGMTSEEKIDRSLNVLQSSLSLSPTQVTKIRELARTRRENLQAIRDESRPKFQQLMSMLKQPNPDPAAVGRTVIELKGIHEQARTKQSDFENQLSSILNPSQRETVEYLRNQGPTTMALRSIGLLGSPDQQGMFTRESE
jgi:Spy/CpxP family protein refolding chaperone